MSNQRDKMTQAEYHALFGAPKVARGTERISSTGKATKQPPRIALGLGLEDDEQAALFQWATTVSGQLPELLLMYAIPNGAKLPYTKGKDGKRRSREALRLLRTGLKPGCPDICLPVSRGGYHSLYIEMKIPPNKTTPEQEWWLKELAAQGNFTVVCNGGWREAKDIILKYLGR